MEFDQCMEIEGLLGSWGDSRAKTTDYHSGYGEQFDSYPELLNLLRFYNFNDQRRRYPLKVGNFVPVRSPEINSPIDEQIRRFVDLPLYDSYMANRTNESEASSAYTSRRAAESAVLQASIQNYVDSDMYPRQAKLAAQFRAKNTVLTQQNKQISSENEFLRSMNTELQSKNAQLLELLGNSKQHIRALTERLQRTNASISNSQTSERTTSLTDQVAQYETMINNLTIRLKEKQLELDDCRRERDAEDLENTRIRSEFAEREKAYQEELKDLRQQLYELQQSFPRRSSSSQSPSYKARLSASPKRVRFDDAYIACRLTEIEHMLSSE